MKKLLIGVLLFTLFAQAEESLSRSAKNYLRMQGWESMTVIKQGGELYVSNRSTYGGDEIYKYEGSSWDRPSFQSGSSYWFKKEMIGDSLRECIDHDGRHFSWMISGGFERVRPELDRVPSWSPGF